MAALKILIVTCTFAPQASPNATYSVRIASYLTEMGGDVRVLTLSERDLLALTPPEPSLSRLSSPRVYVERVDGGIIRRLLRKSGNQKDRIQKLKVNPLVQLLIPDPYMDCIFPLIRRGLAMTRLWRPSIILSIAYPWSSHIVGYILAHIRKTKWVAYYGDPWTYSPASDIPRATWRKWVDAWLEKRLLHRASGVVVTTEKTKSLYLKMFPFLTGKIEVVRAIHFSNRDNSEFINDIRTPGDKRLWIVHSGRIYRGARSPEPLLRALRELLAEHPDLDAKIVVWLVGEVDSQTCDQIEQWHLGSIVKIVPWVPHDEIQQWMRSADWLLLLGNRGGIQVPSKLYEYLGLRKPILVLQEVAEDEASRIVKDVDAGWVIDNDEQSIIQFFRSFLENQIHYPTYQGAIPVETFSLETNLERYWNMLQQIVQT